MADSIDLLEVRFFIFGLLQFYYFTFDFDRVCGRLSGLIGSCLSDSHALNVTVSFKHLCM